MNLTDHPNTTTDSTSTARINSSGASLNINESISLPPVNIDKSFNLLNATLDCGSNAKAELSLDVHPIVHAQVLVGVVATGHLIPPSISDFAVFSSMPSVFFNIHSASYYLYCIISINGRP